MSTIQESLIEEYAKAAGERVCLQAINVLEAITSTLSGDDSPLENAWEEICAQAQGEESFFWDAYQETMHSTVIGILEQLPHRDQVALWLQTEEGWDWHWDEEFVEEQSPRSERGKNTPQVPLNYDDIARYIVSQFLMQAAEKFSNWNIETYLDGGTADDAMFARLVDLMPLNTRLTDLWDWDIRFEESFDGIEDAAFCSEEEFEYYANMLAEDFERYIDEYAMDYNQQGWDTPEEFSVWIKEECLNFMTKWRANVREEFGR